MSKTFEERMAREDAYDSGYDAGYYVGKIDGYKEAMKDIPPVKHGRWVHDSRTQWKCSNCGNFLDFDGLNCGRGSAFFCPNCGADMRGESNG